jgi:hypothetical protein
LNGRIQRYGKPEKWQTSLIRTTPT